MHKEKAPEARGQEMHSTGIVAAPPAGDKPSQQALRVIGGERQAVEFLQRLQAQQADPDELALIVAALYGASLRGFCSTLTKALRGGRP